MSFMLNMKNKNNNNYNNNKKKSQFKLIQIIFGCAVLKEI